MNVEDALFETAGELDIKHSKSDDGSDDETVQPKISGNDRHASKKLVHFLYKLQLDQLPIYLILFLI